MQTKHLCGVTKATNNQRFHNSLKKLKNKKKPDHKEPNNKKQQQHESNGKAIENDGGQLISFSQNCQLEQRNKQFVHMYIYV